MEEAQGAFSLPPNLPGNQFFENVKVVLKGSLKHILYSYNVLIMQQACFKSDPEALKKFDEAFSNNILPFQETREEKIAKIRSQLEIVFEHNPELLEDFDSTMAATQDNPEVRQFAMSMIESAFPPNVPKEESYQKIRDRLQESLKSQPELMKAFDEMFKNPQPSTDLNQASTVDQSLHVRESFQEVVQGKTQESQSYSLVELVYYKNISLFHTLLLFTDYYSVSIQKLVDIA